jgi:hypothetical protein
VAAAVKMLKITAVMALVAQGAATGTLAVMTGKMVMAQTAVEASSTAEVILIWAELAGLSAAALVMQETLAHKTVLVPGPY